MQDLVIFEETFPFSHLDCNGSPVYKVESMQVAKVVEKIDELWVKLVLKSFKDKFGTKP